MKIKNWIWAGCMALLLGSLAFVACEDKSNVGGGGGGGSDDGGGSSTSGTIVGVWKSVAGTTMYDQQSYTITFNADKTGSILYVEDEPEEAVEFDFTYTFNTSTNIGRLKPEGYYDEDMEFKVVWKTKDRVEIYTRDAYYSDYYSEYGYYDYGDYDYDYEYYDDYDYEYYGYDGWELLATFERQGSSDPGEGGGGGATYSIVGSWKYGPSADEYLVLTFNSGSSCVYKYFYDGESVTYNGTYTYNASTCKGRMKLKIPEYPEEPAYLDFKLVWQSKDAVYVYIVEEEGEYYDEEELLGLFTRI